MNFELEKKLNKLLKVNQLDEAIELVEGLLGQLSKTDFHKILGKNFLHLSIDLAIHLNNFDNSATVFFEGQRIGAIYSEINGFTINYDLWYIDVYAYSFYKGVEDLAWLGDMEFESAEVLTLTGFEDLQGVFQDYMENEKWENDLLKEASGLCEYLIILRLQELFRQAFIDGKSLNHSWIHIPVLVTAHDYELIYEINRDE